MLPQNHFLIGLLVSIILYFSFPDIEILSLVIFLIATVGIDVDHYLYYVYRKKDWSLRNSVRWFLKKGRALRKIDARERSEFYTGFCFLHGVEVLILLGFLGYFVWNIFYFVLLGFALHLVLDYVNEFKRKNRFDKFSIIYDYFKYGKLKFVDELEGLAKI